ncbi:MAG: hypothetical protein WC054_02110 [Candidatus Nanopelagicales bacterium]
MFSAAILQRTSRAIAAVGAVVCGLLIASVAFSSAAIAAPLTVVDNGGFFASTASQANLEQCVSSVLNTKVKKEGKDKAINEIEVSFSQKNECAHVRLTVNVVDGDDRLSEGSLPNLPLGAKDKVVVKLTGDAARNDKPEFYYNIS